MGLYDVNCLFVAVFIILCTGVTAQINPPDWTIPGYSLDYTPGYTLGAPRVYPTSRDYTPPDSGWGIVWAIRVYSGRYHIWLTIWLTINYRYNIWGLYLISEEYTILCPYVNFLVARVCLVYMSHYVLAFWWLEHHMPHWLTFWWLDFQMFPIITFG